MSVGRTLLPSSLAMSRIACALFTPFEADRFLVLRFFATDFFAVEVFLSVVKGSGQSNLASASIQQAEVNSQLSPRVIPKSSMGYNCFGRDSNPSGFTRSLARRDRTGFLLTHTLLPQDRSFSCADQQLWRKSNNRTTK
jgi:hypothetical protein